MVLQEQPRRIPVSAMARLGVTTSGYAQEELEAALAEHFQPTVPSLILCPSLSVTADCTHEGEEDAWTRWDVSLHLVGEVAEPIGTHQFIEEWYHSLAASGSGDWRIDIGKIMFLQSPVRDSDGGGIHQTVIV